MNRALLTSYFVAALSAVAQAEDHPKPLEKTLLVRPSKMPSPALRIRLLPTGEEQIAGDAAVFYHRAIESLIGLRHREELQAMKRKPAVEEASAEQLAVDWLAAPSDRLPKDQARELLDRRATALEEVRLGSLRETCDWGFRRRSEGFMLTLGDVQEMRSLSRWVALKARLDLQDGKIDEALQGMKTGLAMARDVGRSDSYIQSLIAMAGASLILDVMEEIVQKPDCPSLYWALASLPGPFLDLESARASEATMLEREIPMLRKLAGEVWSIETAREFAGSSGPKLGMLLDGWPRVESPLSRPSLKDAEAHGRFLLLVAKDYSRARRALEASGVPKERLGAMPMLQVVACDSFRTFETRRDELAKWSYLPIWLGAKGWAEAERNCSSMTPGIPFVQLLPASRNVSAATARFERRIAVLQVIEGLRLYAASHGGTLPARLQDLTESPAPHDPVTGSPFEYRLEGDRAVLTSPAPAGQEQVPHASLRYEFRTKD